MYRTSYSKTPTEAVNSKIQKSSEIVFISYKHLSFAFYIDLGRILLASTLIVILVGMFRLLAPRVKLLIAQITGLRLDFGMLCLAHRGVVSMHISRLAN
jgi:hypothetical protein